MYLKQKFHKTILQVIHFNVFFSLYVLYFISFQNADHDPLNWFGHENTDLAHTWSFSSPLGIPAFGHEYVCHCMTRILSPVPRAPVYSSKIGELVQALQT